MRKLILLFIFFPFIGLAQVQYGQTMYGNVTNELFGKEPSFSADNTRMVSLDNISGANSVIGHAKVFDLIDNTWTQVGQTIEFSAVGPLHQSDVSISSDGNIIAVASVGNSPTVVESGSIKVYELIDNNWIQIGQEIFPLTVGEFFAETVSLSSDGTTLAAGAHSYDSDAPNSGYVRVFEYVNNTWEQKGSFLEGEDNSRFGTDVSLSSDGNILACSATGTTNTIGYIKIFEYINNDWVETGIINEVIDDEYIGYRIVLTPNGTTLALSSFSSELGYLTGQVRVYEKIADNWIQKGSGFSGVEAQEFLGEEISISDDGTILAMGAPRHDFEGENIGYIKLYKYENNDWVLFGEQLRGNNTNDYFGTSFSLSPDGTRLAVGTIYDDTNAVNSGKLITYDLTSALSTKEFNSTNFNLYPNPTNNKFIIQLENPSDLKNVNIYNNLGQLVSTAKETTIVTSTLAAGLYVVEIETTKGKGSKKLIIE